MSKQLEQVQQELDEVAHSLFKISPDCVRAMSTHEAEDEVRATRKRIDRIRELVKTVRNA